MSTVPTSPGIESLTLIVSKEIRVEASLEDTFAALLEQLGPESDTTEGHKMPMKIEPWPRRTLVPRPGRQQRSFVGTRAVHQAADTAGNLGTAVHVVRHGLECAVSP